MFKIFSRRPKKNDCRIAIGENVNGQRCDPVLQYVQKRAEPSVTAANTFSLYNANTSELLMTAIILVKYVVI